MADTANRGYPLPTPANDINTEVFVLIAAFSAIDADVASLTSSLANKSDVGHHHALADVDGLIAALAGKMSADATFSIEDLVDVNVGAGAPTGWLLVKQADGSWVPLSPSAAFEAVTVAISAVTGLSEALAALALQSSLTDLATTVSGKVATADKATVAQIMAATVGKWLSADQAWAAVAHHDQTGSGTITLDFNTGVNFRITANGNVTVASPANQKSGQSGMILLSQDATGGRTFSFASNWHFPGGVAPSIPTTAGTNAVLFYQVYDPSFIVASIATGF